MDVDRVVDYLIRLIFVIRVRCVEIHANRGSLNHLDLYCSTFTFTILPSLIHRHQHGIS